MAEIKSWPKIEQHCSNLYNVLSTFYKRIPLLYRTKCFFIVSFLWCVSIVFYGFRNNAQLMTLGLGDQRNLVRSGVRFRQVALQTCVHPALTIDDPVMTKFLFHYPPVVCKGTKDWVYVYNGTLGLRIPRLGFQPYPNVSCDYFPLWRVDDDNVTWGQPSFNISSGFRITSDFFRVVCMVKGRVMYDRAHAGVAYTADRAERPEVPLPEGFNGLGVAILGFDSMSRMSWLRRLNETRHYFHHVLGAIELKHHNIVGDGTTAVMLPMLTGKFEWELPECRRNFPNATTMDKFPFLWHAMKDAGYLTSWANAATHSAPFNYRMMGFAERPTDFYTRPFYLAVRNSSQENSQFCLGSRSKSEVWLNYFRDIFVMYKKKRKFLVHFLVDMSHDDNNLITTMDRDIRNLVQFLYRGGYLRNTVLILMGDHGARYNEVRATWSGKLEERLPYVSFLFPKWFQFKYPEAIRNFRTNSQRLTTPFDIHETLKDFLNFKGTGQGQLSKRGISLFKEIPIKRTCSHAGIAPHWCACLVWEVVSPHDPGAIKAMQTTISRINSFTSAYRSRCALLSIANVTSLTKLQTNREVLTFSKADADGGIYNLNFNDTQESGYALYQLTFVTVPGGGRFEVTVTHDALRGHFTLNEKDISRINKYGNDPACILNENRQIRQYCYCKSHIPT